ncbi:hypothetical protein [Methylobacterium brachiatum]|uniref:hypothetical protein n=1 Tax=Methylobacterium brachiatum TaxID=269660 RepID=UPI000EFB97C6|nr:hypothetical protein [Methylobacterium brachiatum]AYO85533.1 hypothetical protein EBB05_27095 [Methylobacterium brachiatum]
MIRLLTRFARFLPGAALPHGEQPATRLPHLHIPMLDGGILACADLAAQFVDLPGLLRERQPPASGR